MSVPWSSMWVITPFLLAILLANLADFLGLQAWGLAGLAPGWVILAIGAVAMMALHVKYSPLIKK